MRRGFAGGRGAWGLLASVALLIAVPFGVARWRTGTAAAADRSPLAASPGDVDFGAVWARPDHEMIVPVVNRTDRIVRVTEVRPHCGCTDVSPAGFALAPGETIPLRLTLDLLPRRDERAAEETRPFTSTVDLIVPDRRRPASLTVHGTVRHLLRSSPRVVFGGRDVLVCGGGGGGKNLRLEPHAGVKELRLTGPARRANAPADPPGGEWDSEPAAPEAELRREPDGAYRLAVAVPPAAEPGTVEYHLPLAAVLDTGETVGGLSAAVVVEAVPDLEILPAAPRYQSAKVNEPAAVVVTVRSRTGRPFALLGAASPSATVTPAADADQPRASHALTLERRPSEPGTFQDDLRLITRHGTRTVSVRGYAR